MARAFRLERLVALAAARTCNNQCSSDPRPTGVTVLAILTFLAANFSFLVAVLFLPYSIFLSAAFVGIGFIDFVFAMGYLSGSGWAWTLGIIFAIIGIAGGFAEIAFGITFPVIGLIPSIVTILYLTRPHVKVFFGKGFVPGSGHIASNNGFLDDCRLNSQIIFGG